jgi:glycosyltransferase involved in cell wall biosynthesis
MKPLISLIIPTLNEEKYIGKLLESIKLQDFPHETIIADGGSQDKTLEIAKKYDTIILKKNKNTPKVNNDGARARNDAARIARADWLLFLDADVVLKKGFLKECYDEIKKRGLDAATCYAFPDTKSYFHMLNFEVANSWMFFFKNIKPFAWGFCIFAKKTIHDRINGYDDSITFGDDSNYIIKASKLGKFGILNKYIHTSVRRFVKEGEMRSLLKYAYLNFYRLFAREIKKDINYKSDYTKLKKV